MQPPLHPLAERAASAPELPGCYLWKDASGAVLYVGKAKILRRRIASYLQPRQELTARIRRMIAEAVELEWFITGSEVEALLLENQLIKELAPRFNILLKDGKQFPLVAITREDFPRVFITRERERSDCDFIGPFTSPTDLRRAFHFVQRAFRFRTCDLDIRSDSPWRRHFAPCLNFHIRRCSAPCTHAIEAAAYGDDIQALRRFLLGRGTAPLLDALRERMREHALALRFEDAARIRDQMQAISGLKQRGTLSDWADAGAPVRDVQVGAQALREHLALPTTPRIIEGFDNAHQGGQHVVAACVRFVGGVPDKDGYRRFKLRGHDGAPGNDDYAAMEEVVARHYKRLVDEGRELPDLILIDGGHGQLARARAALSLAGAPYIPLISLAKRIETICIGDDQTLQLRRTDPGLKLLQHVRDEAHRFCRRYLHLLQRQALRDGSARTT